MKNLYKPLMVNLFSPERVHTTKHIRMGLKVVKDYGIGLILSDRSHLSNPDITIDVVAYKCIAISDRSKLILQIAGSRLEALQKNMNRVYFEV